MATGGSIQEVSIRGRIFPATADADAKLNLGGFNNEVSPNGDGSSRTIKKRVAWAVGGLKLQIDNDRGDLEFLQEIADGEDYVAMTVTLVDGTTYGGVGQVADEIASSTGDTTCEITLSGPKKLEKQ
jgi:hypothetical protein